MAIWPLRRVAAVVLWAIALAAPAAQDTPVGVVRIGLTAVILTDRQPTLDAWSDYLQLQLKRPVSFVQRRTYHEIVQFLLAGKLDAAWLCGYPYIDVNNRPQLRLLAVPLYQNRPLYRSYLIVPAEDRQTQAIGDLAGGVFAFSDPDSNSGYLVPQFDLYRQGLDPARVFRKTFFTWSHRDVVRAVADGVAQGGAVDGYIWDTLARLNPALTARTRIVSRSPWFGFPPVVSHRDVDPGLFAALRQALLAMAAAEDGRRVLTQLNLDGFTAGSDDLYDGIEAMAERVKS